MMMRKKEWQIVNGSQTERSPQSSSQLWRFPSQRWSPTGPRLQPARIQTREFPAERKWYKRSARLPCEERCSRILTGRKETVDYGDRRVFHTEAASHSKKRGLKLLCRFIFFGRKVNEVVNFFFITSKLGRYKPIKKTRSICGEGVQSASSI